MANIGHEEPSGINSSSVTGIDTPDVNIDLPLIPLQSLRETRFRSRQAASVDPSKAEFYIPENFTAEPIDYQEPKPFAIEGEGEWTIFQARKEAIRRKSEEETQGTF